jgi:hypothetical protein
MQKQELATLYLPPDDLVTFAPPTSAKYDPMVDGRLEMLPLAGVIGVVSRRFNFAEPGGPDHLKPGRPLSQSVPINRPPNAGFFVMLNGVNHAFVRSGSPTTLTQRPLGQIFAIAGLSGNSLVCNVRLTDENMDDPMRCIVDVVVVFFN